jgi:hypothetical protein
MIAIGNNIPTIALRSAGSDPYKSFWYSAAEGAKSAGATIENLSGSCLMFRGSIIYNSVPPKPSLLIVPQFYKEGNLYQDVPPFVAEDTTMRFTVTRATTATRVNSSGLIESVASGVPRIDWQGQSCPALLVEASAQNLVLQSQNFENATHTKFNLNAFGSGSVADTTATLDPYGTNVADYIQENSASGVVHAIIDIFAGNVSGTTYTWSVFAKAAERTIIQLFNNGGGGGVGTYNLLTGVASGTGSSMQNYGNGWWRCVVTYTSNNTGNHNVQIRLCDASGNATYNGTGNQGAYIFGAQLETGAVATTYIPTTTAAVPRNADQISASGALVSGLIGQSAGTIYAEVDVRNWSASGRILTLSDNTSDNRIMMQVGANRTLQAIVTTASADVADISTASGQVNGIYKCAIAYASGDFAFYVNGTQIGTDSSGGVPACTSVYLGKIGTTATTNQLNDRIRSAALYTTRLSNDQLAELTKL